MIENEIRNRFTFDVDEASAKKVEKRIEKIQNKVGKAQSRTADIKVDALSKYSKALSKSASHTQVKNLANYIDAQYKSRQANFTQAMLDSMFASERKASAISAYKDRYSNLESASRFTQVKDLASVINNNLGIGKSNGNTYEMVSEAFGEQQAIQEAIKNNLPTLQRGMRIGKTFGLINDDLTKVKGNIKDSLKNFTSLFGAIKRIAVYRLIRTALKSIVNAAKEGINNYYAWSKAMGGTFAKAMDVTATKINTMKNSLATALAPFLENVILPLINKVTDAISRLATWLSKAGAIIQGNSFYTVATEQAKAYGQAQKKALLGFDELNRLDDNGSGASGAFKNKNLGELEAEQIKNQLAEITSYFHDAMLPLGALLAFSGTNIPLGLGLMALGAKGWVNVVQANWDMLSDEVKVRIASIESIVSDGLIAIGAILLFSDKIPLGLGMLATGLYGKYELAQLNWSAVSDKVKDQIGGIMMIVGSASLALGAILLACDNWKLGVPLLIAGVSSFVTATAINWDALKNKLAEVWKGITNWYQANVAPKLTGAYWQVKIDSLMQSVANAFKNGWEKVKQFVSDIFNLGYVANVYTTNNAGKHYNPMTDTYYANGGTPPTGSLFWAGEAGPELITQVGSRSTVFNEQQLGGMLFDANKDVVNALLQVGEAVIGAIEKKPVGGISSKDIRTEYNRLRMQYGG